MQAKELGLRVAAVDRNPDAPGLKEADIAKVVDFADVDAVLKATASQLSYEACGFSSSIHLRPCRGR
jgi:formate-dependent phosphoribosylglycinamide formyltransferase (GAR transformylase)